MSGATPPLLAAPLTLAEIARIVSGRLQGDGELRVRGVARPDEPAGAEHLVLVLDRAGLGRLQPSTARCVMLAEALDPPAVDWHGLVWVADPRQALARLLPHFQVSRPVPTGVHPSAVVEPSAQIAATASIGPLTYVGAAVRIAPRVQVLANCTLAEGCQLGEDTVLHPGVRIGAGVCVGQRVIIHANACIGADGFSFVIPDTLGAAEARGGHQITATDWEPLKIPSLGTVVIEDDVEIGACATIDRATLGATRIGRGTKIDNLVMVGHNSQLGVCCLIAGQSGIAGSCELGDHAVMGGQSGIADHVQVGAHAVIAAGSGVSQDVPRQTLVIDTPAIPYPRWQERYRGLSRIKRMLAEIERLRQRLLRLEQGDRSGPPDTAG